MADPLYMKFKPGDVVGIAVPRFNTKGELTGTKIVVKGMILNVYRPSPRSKWRAEVSWENKNMGWLYTGRYKWAYLSELTFIRKAIPRP